jgi:hypothetical protein
MPQLLCFLGSKKKSFLCSSLLGRTKGRQKEENKEKKTPNFAICPHIINPHFFWILKKLGIKVKLFLALGFSDAATLPIVLIGYSPCTCFCLV